MRAAFGISFSSTMRIIKPCASFEHKIHSPKECVQLKHTILHETHTKVKHIQCTHVCYFLTKKVDFYTNWKPQKCNWSWYLNKIIMKTCILSETSTVKHTKKKIEICHLSLPLSFYQCSWTDLVSGHWKILVCSH